MATREVLLAEFDHEVAATRRILRCLPDDRLGWQPHARSRTLAALAWHIVEIASWSPLILGREGFDLAEAPGGAEVPSSSALILARFDEVAARARQALDRSEAELHAPWRLQREGQDLFSMPRAAAFRAFVLGHVVHHRGQLTVYLRLNDVPLPPVYGPTADSVPDKGGMARTDGTA